MTENLEVLPSEIVVKDDQETGTYGGALLRRRNAVEPDQPALAPV